MVVAIANSNMAERRLHLLHHQNAAAELRQSAEHDNEPPEVSADSSLYFSCRRIWSWYYRREELVAEKVETVRKPHADGMPIAKIARTVDVSRSTVYSLIEERAQGSARARKGRLSGCPTGGWE